MKFLGVCTAFLSLSALAQSAIPTTFPEGAIAATAQQLKTRLTDRVFGARMTNGDDWRFEYKSNGYFFLNTVADTRIPANGGQRKARFVQRCRSLVPLAARCAS